MPRTVRPRLRRKCGAEGPGALVVEGRPGDARRPVEGDIVSLIKVAGDVADDGASGPRDFDENGDVLGPCEIWEVQKG